MTRPCMACGLITWMCSSLLALLKSQISTTRMKLSKSWQNTLGFSMLQVRCNSFLKGTVCRYCLNESLKVRPTAVGRWATVIIWHTAVCLFFHNSQESWFPLVSKISTVPLILSFFRITATRCPERNDIFRRWRHAGPVANCDNSCRHSGIHETKSSLPRQIQQEG